MSITTTSKEAAATIEKSLQNALSTSAGLQSILRYKFTQEPVAGPASVTVVPGKPLPNVNPAAAKSLLTSLMDPEVLEDNGIALGGIFSATKSTVKDGVVFSREIKDDDLAGAWEKNINYILRFFDGVSVEQLRAVLENENDYLPEPAELPVGSNKTFGRGLLQECFGLQRFENPTRIVAYFNVKRFHEFLYPPEITIANTEGENFTLTLDEEHFVAHLKSLLQSSVLLRLFKDGQQQAQALPIPLGLEPSAPKQASYCLVMDISGSMSGPPVETLKKQAIDFLKMLKAKGIERGEQPSDIFIKLVFFESEVHQTQEKTLAEIDELITILHQQNGHGGTSLRAGVEAAINDITARSLTEKRQHSVILFTDGCAGDLRQNQVERFLNELRARFSGLNLDLPNFYTFGYGSVDAGMLQAIAGFGHNQYTELPTIADFARILAAYSPEMRTQREIVEILQTLANASGRQGFSIPVYGSLGPQLPRVIIPMQEGQPLSIIQDGRELTISYDPNDIPDADLHTNLAAIAIRVAGVARDAQVTDKPAAYQRLQAELLALRSEAEVASAGAAEYFNMVATDLGNHLGSSSSAPANMLLLSRAPAQQAAQPGTGAAPRQNSR